MGAPVRTAGGGRRLHFVTVVTCGQGEGTGAQGTTLHFLFLFCYFFFFGTEIFSLGRHEISGFSFSAAPPYVSGGRVNYEPVVVSYYRIFSHYGISHGIPYVPWYIPYGIPHIPWDIP